MDSEFLEETDMIVNLLLWILFGALAGWIAGKVKSPQGDYRNWRDIELWAEMISMA